MITLKQNMKTLWDHYQNDISSFLGGFTFTTCFAFGTLITSVLTAIMVGFFGGIAGVIAKEVGTYIVRRVKNYFS